MPEVDYELYKLITVSGADATQFLQGQLTQDVNLLAGKKSLAAACCSPQGRVITTVRLIPLDENIGMILPVEMSEPVVALFSKYRMRSDVQFEISGNDWSEIAIIQDADALTLRSAALLPEPNDTIIKKGIFAFRYASTEPFVELFGKKSALERVRTDFNAPLERKDWDGALIRAGVPMISDENSEKYTPHMLNLDKLGAISFDKGCYTGQEVVARTEHLGSSKRRLMRYRCEAKSIEVGDGLMDGDRSVGKVVNVSGEDLLAVTPVAVHEKALVLGGEVAEPVGLPYVL
jgi:folate-binding protein YgfZ